MIVGLVSEKEKIEDILEIRFGARLEYGKNYNIHPGEESIFLSSEKPTELIKMRSGLTPFWSKNEIVYHEAPLEGSDNKQFNKLGIVQDIAFRKPIRENRGLLPVDYFIVESFSGIPYLVFLKEKKKRPIGLACIWDTWKKEITDPLKYGFAILTVPAYGKFRDTGIKRMPVILNEYHYKKWVRPGVPLMEASQMLHYYAEKDFNAFPVSPEILSNRNNDKTLIESKGDLIEKEKVEQRYIYESYHSRRLKKEAKIAEDKIPWGKSKNNIS